MKVQIINESLYATPSYATKGSSGMDLRANLHKEITLKPNERRIIPTGIKMALATGYEGQVRSKSGQTIKKGLIVANGIGTIDADYRGEIGAIMKNDSDVDITIEPGEKIAQLVIARVEQVDLEEVLILSETVRAEGGFGSTGIQ